MKRTLIALLLANEIRGLCVVAAIVTAWWHR